MRLIFLIVIIGITQTVNIFSQRVMIKKVLDSNLFMLEDSTIVKLAGIDAPQINSYYPELAAIADKFISYSKIQLQNQWVSIEFTGDSLAGNRIKVAYITKKYAFSSVDFTERFLENGFGKFINNVDEERKQKYLNAETQARNGREGIWKYSGFSETDTLDGGSTFLNNSLPSLEVSPKPVYFDRSFGRIATEIILGPVVGLVVSIPSAFITIGLSGTSGWGAFGYGILGMYIGYVIGTPLGVYAVAEAGNENVSYWETLGYSGLGAAMGIGLTYGMKSWAPSGFSLLILPLACSIIYANSVAHYPPVDEINEEQIHLKKTDYSFFKNVYDRNMIFQTEIFRINF